MCDWRIHPDRKNIVVKEQCPHGPKREVACYEYDSDGICSRDMSAMPVLLERLLNSGMLAAMLGEGGDDSGLESRQAVFSLTPKLAELMATMRRERAHGQVLELTTDSGESAGSVIIIANSSIGAHLADAFRSIMDAALNFKKEM
jgi:hypothetical protein